MAIIFTIPIDHQVEVIPRATLKKDAGKSSEQQRGEKGGAVMIITLYIMIIR